MTKQEKARAHLARAQELLQGHGSSQYNEALGFGTNGTGNVTAQVIQRNEDNPEERFENSHTALSHATRIGNFELARTLIDSGADVNVVVQLPGTDTEYHLLDFINFNYRGSGQFLSDLLDAGSDPNKMNRDHLNHLRQEATESRRFRTAITLIDEALRERNSTL